MAGAGNSARVYVLNIYACGKTDKGKMAFTVSRNEKYTREWVEGAGFIYLVRDLEFRDSIPSYILQVK